jgi:hypothetical protein
MSYRRCLLGSLLVFAIPLCAQEQPASNGLQFNANVQGSYNSLGEITRLDASAGYIFNRHFQADIGLPYYLVSPSEAPNAATASGFLQGIGNAYAQVRFLLPSPALDYISTVTGTAPTGDRNKGLSTGHATVDWSNYFDKSFWRLTPFAEVGIANAVSDTMFFIRPYETYGFVAHAQGGVRYRFASWMQAGAAGYVIEPHGRQTVVSRMVTVSPGVYNGGSTAPVSLPGLPGLPSIPAPVPGGSGGVAAPPVFETSTVTTGTASLDRDDGFSTWVLFGKSPGVTFQVGYTRSAAFGLNTLFFGAGYNLRKMFGKS